MSKDIRYQQATREARWALWLTIFYLVGWCVSAYLTPKMTGLLGFPLWFELSCIYLPILFIVLIYVVIKRIYRDIDLETPTDLNK